MLADLRIENLAVIERVRARFGGGLNVISGETGAGKTILLQALKLALGARAKSGLVRAGADEAWVEARFELDGVMGQRVKGRLGEIGLPDAESELIVRRQVTRDGKSRAYINDASTTIGALGRVTEELVELTGQHEKFGLLRASAHRAILDGFAGNESLVARMAEDVRALRRSEQRCKDLWSDLAQRDERHEFLHFQLRDFTQLQPAIGEDELLLLEAQRLRYSERLRSGLSRAERLLYQQSSSAYDLVSQAREAIASLQDADPRLENDIEKLDALLSELDDTSRRLGRMREEAIDEPERLEQVESRLHAIQRFSRKHGGDLTAAVQKMEAAQEELGQLSDLELCLKEAESDLKTRGQTAQRSAAELTARRREASTELVEATLGHLRDLGFTKARFEVSHAIDDELEALSERGADRIEFYLALNPGHPTAPLAQIASGGELSRILLALKCAQAQAETWPMLVLDEVDSGIGGATAEVVGRKIRQLADQTQVLCVTHLPQIASFADTHLAVTKQADGNATRTEMRSLAPSERENELARMLGGAEITQTTLEHAREMLGRASVAGPGL